jgi:FdhD protein
MDLVTAQRIWRFESGRREAAVDPVVAEARVELNVNDGEARVALLCLPAELEALAVGFLVGEGALRRHDQLHAVEVAADGGQVSIRGDFDPDVIDNLHVRWTWASGCGGGGTGRDLRRPGLTRLAAGPELPCGRLAALAEAFARRAAGTTNDDAPQAAQHPAGLWRRTGGVHACALADAGGLLLFAEDVGRHNAYDKVIGAAFLGGIERADKIVLTTGRLSAEIAAKAVAAGVPILASRSAVTSLAVAVARRFGLTLVGFARGKRLNVYAGFDRVLPEEEGAAGADA